MPPSLITRTKEAFWGLLGPWLFLSISASFLPTTVSQILRTGPTPLSALLTLLSSPASLRAALFGQFWAKMGPDVRDGAADKVLPLLDGRTSQGRVVSEPAGPGIGGVVLEIGAATGLWVDVFSDRHLFQADEGANANANADTDAGAGAGAGAGADAGAVKGPRTRSRAQQGSKKKRADTARTPITRVYGVEPNEAHHAALRRAVEAAGLKDIYEIVPVGIEDLSSSSSATTPASKNKKTKKWEGNIEPGSVDCIVSVLCLCSIPDPKRHVHELYELLRPGGRWYIYEHVRCEYSWYMRLYQRVINLVWPHLIGGCELCRPTAKTLSETGPWTKIDVGQPPTEQWYACVPHRLGVFTK